jgi:serine/threonine protein kinase
VDPEVRAGQVLAGRYRLGRLLGEGGMARVFDGFDSRLARPVAVKLLRPEVAAHPDMRQRFEREARAAARLSHPNVVAVYDSGEDGGVAYLVMERLPGLTLADRIRQGPIPSRQVEAIGRDVLAALGSAHALGMVHRDIKPGNILLDADGRPKVADFGIAKSVQLPGQEDTGLADLTSTGLVVGTPAYLSPERLVGRPATAQADLYALGVVMWEALTGHKPGTPGPSLANVRAPAGLAAVVQRAMQPRPEDRYQSARDMAADLVDTGAAATRPLGPPTEVLPAAQAAAAGPTRLAGAVAAVDVVERRPPAPPRRPRDWRKVGAAVLAGLIVAGVIVAIMLTNFASPSGNTPAHNPPASGTTRPATTTPTTPAPTSTSTSTTSTSTTTTSTTTTTTTPTTTKPGKGGPGHGHGGPSGPGSSGGPGGGPGQGAQGGAGGDQSGASAGRGAVGAGSSGGATQAGSAGGAPGSVAGG